MENRSKEELERDAVFLCQIITLYQEKEKLNKEIVALKEEIDCLKKEVRLAKESKIQYIPCSPTPGDTPAAWPIYPSNPIYREPVITCSDGKSTAANIIKNYVAKETYNK